MLVATRFGADVSLLAPLNVALDPFGLWACAALALYSGVKFARYKLYKIDCKTDAVFFVTLSLAFFSIFLLAVIIFVAVFFGDVRDVPPYPFLALLLVASLFASQRVLKSSNYNLSNLYEQKMGAEVSNKFLFYVFLVFAAIVAILFLAKRF